MVFFFSLSITMLAFITCQCSSVVIGVSNIPYLFTWLPSFQSELRNILLFHGSFCGVYTDAGIRGVHAIYEPHERKNCYE